MSLIDKFLDKDDAWILKQIKEGFDVNFSFDTTALWDAKSINYYSTKHKYLNKIMFLICKRVSLNVKVDQYLQNLVPFAY